MGCPDPCLSINTPFLTRTVLGRYPMKTKIKYSAIIFACFLIVLVFNFSGARGEEQRQTISTAQRALDMLEVQNTMSKHSYLSVFDHARELKEIWVREDGEFAKTAHWTNPQGIQEGIDLIKKNYVTDYMERQKKLLEEINKLYPEIKVSPENYGIGSWGFNDPTNPVIEIAGDGKTAKGIWNSNGPSLSTSVVDGKLSVHGTWFWRTYAVDFVKEDGKWKIWHMNIVYDISSPLDAEYGMDYTKYKASTGGGSSYLTMNKPNPNPYQPWSPLRIPQNQPRIPEPYYTFSETFSY